MGTLILLQVTIQDYNELTMHRELHPNSMIINQKSILTFTGHKVEQPLTPTMMYQAPSLTG